MRCQIRLTRTRTSSIVVDVVDIIVIIVIVIVIAAIVVTLGIRSFVIGVI